MRVVCRVPLLFAGVVFLISAAGCSDEESGTSDESSQPSASVRHGEGQPGFDPNDFDATVRWIASQVATVTQADSQSNQLLAAQRLDEVQAAFSEMEGQTVHWEIPVSSIREEVVFLKYIYERVDVGGAEPASEQYPVFLYISGLEEESPRGQPTPGGDWIMSPLSVSFPSDFQLGLEIGTVISTPQALQLSEGDQLLVTGEVAYCSLSGYGTISGGRALALCIVDAKCPD